MTEGRAKGITNYMPKKSRAASRIFSSTSTEPLSLANFSMPVRAMGRTNSGMFASRASASGVQWSLATDFAD